MVPSGNVLRHLYLRTNRKSRFDFKSECRKLVSIMAQFYPYIGNSLQTAEVSELYETIRDSNIIGPGSREKIDAKIRTLNEGKKTWRDMLIQGYVNRVTPEFSVDDVNTLNQLHTTEVQKKNRQKTNQLEAWKNTSKQIQIEISSLTRLSLKENFDASKHAQLTRAKIGVTTELRDQAHANADQVEAAKLNKEVLLMECDLMTTITEANLRIDEYGRQVGILQDKKDNLALEIETMELLPSPETINRNLILYTHNTVKGWIPSNQEYSLLKNNKAPPDAEIFKYISVEPETSLTNLPLTISKLIDYSETIGADDKCLLNIIVQYMNRYKKELMNTMESKKHSLRALIHAIAEQCSTAQEKTAIVKEMRSFYRKEDESFAACLNRFDSMHLFYLQLDRPQPADELKHLSYQLVQSLTQFIISEKCAQVYSSWAKIQRTKGHTPTKEDIIKIIGELEENADLRPKTALRLAPQVVATLLHLPAEVRNIECAVADTSRPPSKERKSRSKERKNSSSSYNSSSSSKNSQKPSTPQNRSGSRNGQPFRSQSPGNNQQRRGQSARLRSESRGSINSERWRKNFFDLQAPPRHVPDWENKHVNTWSTLRPHYKGEAQKDRNTFYKDSLPVKNSEKYRDVREKNKCLRCYGDHRPRNCPRFQERTPDACKYCRYLYHPTEKCPKYDDQGKTRPPTPN